MPRPDPSRIAINAGSVFGNAGEVVTRRVYVSASAGNPRFGIANANTYNESLITALFFFAIRGIPSKEIYNPGGLIEQRSLTVATQVPLNARDELIWRGTAYRVDGAPVPENIGGTVQYQAPIVIASITG